MLEELARLSGLPVHPGLKGLAEKEVRHHRLAGKDEFKDHIEDILGLK